VIAVVFVYIILGLFFEVTPWRQLFLFLIGFFSAFHWIQTVKTLREADQPDLKLAGGKIFSLVTISLANLVVLALVLKGLFPQEVSLSNAAENVARNTWRLGCFLVHYIKGN
ncbi:MAG: hypothetical protein IKO35_05745, partial [Elusimicrobiaceae bacterium]|nr:hypothetical protein [Elusimicrobiaceae bacterium]